jgi:hypothetical protein
MTHNILTLPREVRNLIYDNLSHELEFQWLWHANEELPNIYRSNGPLYDTARMWSDNAPSPGALAAHSRLHEEHIEGLERHDDLSVSITLDLGSEYHVSYRDAKENTDA